MTRFPSRISAMAHPQLPREVVRHELPEILHGSNDYPEIKAGTPACNHARLTHGLSTLPESVG
ncbi:hypothetical protein OKW41_008234 [Paraburkholderia sp. UCT70]